MNDVYEEPLPSVEREYGDELAVGKYMRNEIIKVMYT